MSSPKTIVRLIPMCLIVQCLLSGIGVAQDSKPGSKRTPPPAFDPAKARQIFFEDVFSRLEGERPADASTGASSGSAPGQGATATASPGPGASSASPATGAWSKIISPTTIEDEIKSIKLEVGKNVTTPSDFAGRGYKVIRREFSVLAMLFAVIHEYDGEVRFKKDAAAARDLFARTANNAKAGGNTNVFNEAKARKTDLDELLNGSSLEAKAEDSQEWSAIVDRVPLMQRLESAFQTRVNPAMGNKDEFSKNMETVVHESELIALIASVLTQEGMNDADDDTYKGFAESMRQGATEIVEAAKLNSYDQARGAAGKILKACDQCHEAYR